MGVVLAKAVNPFVLNCLTRKHANTQTRKHANTQTRKHANTPTRQHANTPTRQHGNTPTRQHANTPKRLLARDHGIGRVRRGCRPSATKPGGERQAFRRVSGYRISTTLVVGARLGAPSPFPCCFCHGKFPRVLRHPMPTQYHYTTLYRCCISLGKFVYIYPLLLFVLIKFNE